MKKITVYRTKFYFPPLKATIPFILAFICLFIEEIYKERFASYPEFFILIMFFMLIAITGMLIVFINFLHQFKSVIVPFYSSRGLFIKGIVCNLVLAKTKREQDTFEIEGVHFIIGKKWTAGMQKTKIQGGPEIEEGQHLNISYVSVRSQNIIVFVELLVH